MTIGRVKGGKSSTLQETLERSSGSIRVSFDITPEQFFQLLGSMEGPIKIRGRTRTMLELDEVLKIVPVSKSTLLRMLGEGRFPPGHYISPNRRVWYEDDILNWQETLNAPISTRKRRSTPPKKAKAKAAAKKRARPRRS